MRSPHATRPAPAATGDWRQDVIARPLDAPRDSSATTDAQSDRHAEFRHVAPSPLDMFAARCQARAYLYGAGELELHDAVDELQHSAERHGLIDQHGQDESQRIIAAAFRRVRERE